MLLTEEMLAPHQANGQVAVRSTVPADCFSPTADYLKSNFYSPDGVGDPKHSLRAVPVLAFTTQFPIHHARSRSWFGLLHQCGGHSNQQVAMIATILEPGDHISAALNEIVRSFYYAETGHFDYCQRLVSQIVKYSNALSAIGLDCESHWRDLVEALYPVDPTDTNILQITGDQNLVESLRRGGLFDGARYSSGDPRIFLLAQNSD